MPSTSAIWYRSTAVLAVILLGCGESRLQPASGRVLIDGQPLNVGYGEIMFYPSGGGRPAVATIGPAGNFTLSFSEEGDGLPEGEYKVVIVGDNWIEKPGAVAAPADSPDAEFDRPSAGRVQHVIPTIYNDVETTPLTETVTRSAAPLEFVFDIPSKRNR